MEKKNYQSVLESIGQTPLIRLNSVTKDSPHEFYAKVEYFNPGGSVKDRIGLAMIRAAEARGQLRPGATIIEATSGNTGIGLAMVATLAGYRCIFVMPDKISQEKRDILKAYGAKVIITPTGVAPEDPLSCLAVGQIDAPPTPQEWVDVHVRAASLNHHDVFALTGQALKAELTEMAELQEAAAPLLLSAEEERRIAHERIEKALAALHPRYAQAIRLRLGEERPRAECAELLAVSVETFDVLLFRAVRAFRKAYGCSPAEFKRSAHLSK